MSRFTKKLFSYIVAIFLILGSYNIALAGSHPNWIEIKKIKKEIIELGEVPKKRKGLQGDSKWLKALKEQLKEIKEEIKKEEEKQKKIKAAKEEIIKKIESLGGKPKIDTSDIDNDKEIIDLKKQLNDLKDKIEKDKAEAVEKEKAEKKKAEEKEKREAAIIRVKKEIYFLGGTPIAEFEIETEDAYLEALKKQIEELKIQKEAEEKEIAESIPEWFLIPPQGSDVLMFVRGTAVSDQLQMALDLATNAALRDLGKKVETRLASKSKETIRQAGIGEDQVSKTEINLISSTVVDEVTVSGYEAVQSKLVSLDNGSYRAFILLKYPVAKAYKTYMEKIEESPGLKGRLTKIKDTDAYKELEKAVAQYSGS